MADYTSTEIQAAVEKVVRSAVRRPYGSLGNRDISTTFNDLQEATAGVFVLNSNAPFYVVFLGAQRLLELITTEMETISELVEAIENTTRHVKDIENLSSLSNARVALEALETASSSRTQVFQSIEGVPAFKRYDSNLQQFLDEASANAKYNGQIMPTPKESREKLAGLVADLRDQHLEVVSRATYLDVAIQDYDRMNLPSVLAQGVLSRARQVLASRIDELNALSPSDRLGIIRDVTLDLLVGRAAVRGLGSLRQTTLFALISGLGSVFADVSHTATPASISSDLTGPYPIWTGFSFLDFVLEGSFSFSVSLPGSFLASLDSSLSEPYEVTPTSDVLMIEVDHPSGIVPITVNLTNGPTQTARQIAADINASVGLEPIEAVARVAVLKTQTIANIDRPAVPGFPASDFSFTLPSVPPDWTATGIIEGDYVEVVDSTSALNGTLLVIVPGGVLPGVLLCNWVDGPFPVTVAETFKEVRVGSGQTVRIQIKAGTELQSLTDRIGFGFPSDPANTAVMTTPTQTQILGFVPGAVTYSRSTSAESVATQAATSFASQYLGTPRLGASVELEAFYTGLGRTDPDDPAKLIAYKFRGRGDTAGGGPAGVVFDVSGADSFIAIGDTLVLRETVNLADMNVKGLVTAVSATSITATMDAAILADTNVLVEVGPTLVLTKEYLDLRVSNSASQDGDYTMEVHGQQTIPFEFALESAISLNRAQGGLPYFFDLQLGYKRVIFSSTDTTLGTSIELTTGPFSAANQFFSSLPASGVGSTPHFLLPEDPKSLSEGDTLELYEVSPLVPSRTFEVVGLELSSLLIQISPELETDLAPTEMGQEVQVPFARIRLVKKNNYEILKAEIDAWLALDTNDPAWFAELTRRLNPLLVNTNPTAADVGAARSYVLQLQTDLEVLQAALTAYSVDPVDAVTTLIETFEARGSDRGVSILLQGRFSEFFGLSTSSMSTEGHYRETLKSVQRSDLPIRKVGRKYPALEGSATSEGPDFDFDLSDVESTQEDIEIPGDFDQITPPGR